MSWLGGFWGGDDALPGANDTRFDWEVDASSSFSKMLSQSDLVSWGLIPLAERDGLAFIAVVGPRLAKRLVIPGCSGAGGLRFDRLELRRDVE